MLFLLVSSLLSLLPTPAQEALLKGDCAEFQSALGTRTASNALARSTCGDHSGLSELSQSSDVLSKWARLAEAAMHSDNSPSKVHTLLEGLVFPGEAGEEAMLLQGKALVRMGRSLEARPGLRQILDGKHGAEARYWLAYGAEERGDIAPAKRTYESLWARFPVSEWASKAQERLASLGTVLPSIENAASRELTLARARKLVQKNRAAEALPLFEMLLEAGHLTGSRATEEYAKARFNARDYAGAIEIWESFDPINQNKISAEALFHYALATSRTGDYPKAASIYRLVSQRFPNTRRGDEASYKIGYLDVDAGNHLPAIEQLKIHLKERPDSRYADNARWYIGWMHFQVANFSAAKASFQALVNKHPRSSLAIAAKYWLARIEGIEGRRDAETEGLQELLHTHPHSGYAYFAEAHLGTLAPAKLAGRASTLPTLSPTHPLYESLRLVQSGRASWARSALQAHRERIKRATVEERVEFAQLLIAAGDYRRAKRFLKNACSVASSLVDPAIREICLPRPEASVVTPTAQQHGLDPLLPYAIMTAESALDPSVTSPAGARGLMQIMPFLAEELQALLLPETTFDGERLYIPGYNAWLGTTELGRLYTRFKERRTPALPLAIAGYNGGADAVERWLTTQSSQPAHLQGTDAFMENIGYTETRRYVRKVLGYLMRYRHVYAD